VPWEHGPKSSRYYRTKRVGTQVKREYFGRGVIAHIAAANDERRKRERLAETQIRRADQETWNAVAEPLATLIEWCQTLVLGHCLRTATT